MEIPCPLCGNFQTTLFMRRVQKETYRFSITEPFYGAGQDLRHCRRCGVTFSHPLPTEKELLEGYVALEDPSYLEEEGRIQGAQEVLLQVERILGRRGRLLDVGCFCGTLLQEARRRGWEVEGVEPSEWARKEARQRFHLEIRHASLKEASFLEGSFDAVTLLDVVEHFLDPKKEFDRIGHLLKPDGVLYVMTPDIGSLVARIFRRRWWGCRQEHLFYFTRRALRNFLRTTGFEPVWDGFYSRTFTVGQLLWRLQGISPWTSRFLSPLKRWAWLRDREILINLFDRMAMVARKGTA